MDRPNIHTFREFYASPLGTAVCRVLRQHVAKFWAPGEQHAKLLGFGYATPYLAPFLQEGAPIALMPSAQGAAPWPEHGPGLTCFAAESKFPFPDNSFDRILMIHALEYTEALPVLRELWRILKPQGSLLVIVPNRLGPWYPLPSGRAFFGHRLRKLLIRAQFTPRRTKYALFFPPFGLGAAKVWETIGRLTGIPFGGMLMLEAEKRIYAMPPPVIIPHKWRMIEKPAYSASLF